MSFFDKILQLDRDLFFLINDKWSNSFFDWLLPYTRDANTWIPLYLFLLIFIPLKHKKKGLLWVLLAVVEGACTDLVSSRLIKENIFRLRPCQDPSLKDHIHVLVQYCPHSSSFTSSHAANHFGFATFLYLTLKEYYGKWTALIFLWAFIICYAQAYVGVHYPLDLVGGAIAGSIIGYIFSWVFNKYLRLKKVTA
ncbi:MAG: phosphatase PAP2 family protein [Bacteroidota bacterium]|nr:phosphatase PAP2 family protein [Bacteroidota bacterium]